MSQAPNMVPGGIVEKWRLLERVEERSGRWLAECTICGQVRNLKTAHLLTAWCAHVGTRQATASHPTQWVYHKLWKQYKTLWGLSATVRLSQKIMTQLELTMGPRLPEDIRPADLVQDSTWNEHPPTQANVDGHAGTSRSYSVGRVTSLETIGAELGVTRERTRQIEAGGLAQLREVPELQAAHSPDLTRWEVAQIDLVRNLPKLVPKHQAKGTLYTLYGRLTDLGMLPEKAWGLVYGSVDPAVLARAVAGVDHYRANEKPRLKAIEAELKHLQALKSGNSVALELEKFRTKPRYRPKSRLRKGRTFSSARKARVSAL
jgi:hypothetical protein